MTMILISVIMVGGRIVRDSDQPGLGANNAIRAYAKDNFF